MPLVDRNNKALGPDSITGEILKAGSMILITEMHNLIRYIWLEEKMLADWEKALLIPMYKKGTKQIPINTGGYHYWTEHMKYYPE